MSTPDAVGRLMKSFRGGDQGAGEELAELFYPELRRLAAATMKRERSGHTLQPTALVHELYLELLRTKGLQDRDYGDHERAAFFALAGQMMRRLLVHHARPLSRRVDKVDAATLADTAAPSEPLDDVEDVLRRLERVDPRLRSVVEMRVFEGCTVDEVAERLGVSRRTVHNDWAFARRWLQSAWAPLP